MQKIFGLLNSVIIRHVAPISNIMLDQKKKKNTYITIVGSKQFVDQKFISNFFYQNLDQTKYLVMSGRCCSWLLLVATISTLSIHKNIPCQYGLSKLLNSSGTFEGREN